MPIQIIASKDVLTISRAQDVHKKISQLFLDVHEISGNTFMAPNIIGEVLFVDNDLTFAGKASSPVVIVELKVPSFTFQTEKQKILFVEKATDIVLSACEGNLSKENIWINAVYTVDGLWGIAGKAYTNNQLGNAIEHGAL